MLEQFEYTESPATPQRVVTAQWLSKAGLSKRELAHFAALWLTGEISVKPTAAMAAALFKVSKPYIVEALADLRKAAAAKKRTGHGNGGNGHNGRGHNGNDHYAKLPFTPDVNDLWSHMDDDEREAFVRGHAASIWSAFDHITA
jgi:hypothetical protein